MRVLLPLLSAALVALVALAAANAEGRKGDRAACEEAVRQARRVSPFMANHVPVEAVCERFTGTPSSPLERGKGAKGVKGMPRHSSLMLQGKTPNDNNHGNNGDVDNDSVGAMGAVSRFSQHYTALLELETEQVPGAASDINMLICGLLCQLPDNRECMVPCLKHIRCVGLMADPMKGMGMLEVEATTTPISPHLRTALSAARPASDDDDNDGVELGEDSLADYNDAPPSHSALVPTTALPSTKVQGASRPLSPGVQSGLGGLKSGVNSMGGFLPIALALLFMLIMTIVLKFLGFFLELFVKLRCMFGFYLPEHFMAGICGWRCTGKAQCIFRCLDSYACCDLYLCTSRALQKMGFNPIANMGKIPSLLTDCSDRDCEVSAFGCMKNGKAIPMFGKTQVKLMKMMFGTDADIMEGLEKQHVFPFWMFRLVSQELAIGKGLEAIGSIGNDYDEHMKRVMYYMGQ